MGKTHIFTIEAIFCPDTYDTTTGSLEVRVKEPEDIGDITKQIVIALRSAADLIEQGYSSHLEH